MQILKTKFTSHAPQAAGTGTPTFRGPDSTVGIPSNVLAALRELSKQPFLFWPPPPSEILWDFVASVACASAGILTTGHPVAGLLAAGAAPLAVHAVRVLAVAVGFGAKEGLGQPWNEVARNQQAAKAVNRAMQAQTACQDATSGLQRLPVIVGPAHGAIRPPAAASSPSPTHGGHPGRAAHGPPAEFL